MDLKEYLQKRELDVELHNPILDDEEGTITLYFWNPSGQLVAYQQHRPNVPSCSQKLGPKEARYFTYRKIPTIAVWGVESLYISDGPVFLCEGVFDACRFTYRGYSALAACCNNPPKDFRNWLEFLSRPIVVVCDNDDAGRKLAKYGDYVEVVTDVKDVGEAPESYLQFLISKYT